MIALLLRLAITVALALPLASYAGSPSISVTGATVTASTQASCALCAPDSRTATQDGSAGMSIIKVSPGAYTYDAQDPTYKVYTNTEADAYFFNDPTFINEPNRVGLSMSAGVSTYFQGGDFSENNWMAHDPSATAKASATSTMTFSLDQAQAMNFTFGANSSMVSMYKVNPNGSNEQIISVNAPLSDYGSFAQLLQPGAYVVTVSAVADAPLSSLHWSQYLPTQQSSSASFYMVAVPEPSTLLTMALGLVGIGAVSQGHRRNRKADARA